MPKSKQSFGSNLKALDAHVPTPQEYEEAPEWTDEQIAAADLHEGGKLVRRGRPPSPNRKLEVKLRLDPDVVELLRASGPGWQTRINALLRKTMLRKNLPATITGQTKRRPQPRAKRA